MNTVEDFSFQVVVPTIPAESVETAKQLAERYPEGSDERALFAMIIELADSLEILNSDLEKARVEWDRLRSKR